MDEGLCPRRSLQWVRTGLGFGLRFSKKKDTGEIGNPDGPVNSYLSTPDQNAPWGSSASEISRGKPVNLLRNAILRPRMLVAGDPACHRVTRITRITSIIDASRGSGVD